MTANQKDNMKSKTFTLIYGAIENLGTVRAESAHKVAKWLGGKLTASCPGWAEIVLDAPTEFNGRTVSGRLTIHWNV